MPPFAAAPPTSSAGQIATAAVLGVLAVYWLLPRPRGRSVALGTFAGLAALVVLGSWAVHQFGPAAPDLPGQILFWLFATGAIGFAAAFVAQKNPARGALAFAFVVLSVCGLFLTLAAPFLMAATVIVYAGAVIVTFLFVLMLSQNDGPSAENDRSREPLLGALAGFAFLGLVLFALHKTTDPEADANPPAPPVTYAERTALLDAAGRIGAAQAAMNPADFEAALKDARELVASAVGPGGGPDDRPIPDRLAGKADPRAVRTLDMARKVRDGNVKAFDAVDNKLLGKTGVKPGDLDPLKRTLEGLRVDVLLLAGRADLPARNVANLGYSVYAEHLLAVEMAGTLLLVATIGAVLIAGRKGAAA